MRLISTAENIMAVVIATVAQLSLKLKMMSGADGIKNMLREEVGAIESYHVPSLL